MKHLFYDLFQIMEKPFRILPQVEGSLRIISYLGSTQRTFACRLSVNFILSSDKVEAMTGGQKLIG